MPLTSRPKCVSCNSDNTELWRKSYDGEIQCNECYIKLLHPEDSRDSSNSNSIVDVEIKQEPPEPRITRQSNNNVHNDNEKVETTGRSTDKHGVGSQFHGPIRKSARLKPSRHKYTAVNKTFATKGKSRRVVFKKNVMRAADAVATAVTSDYVFYKSNYYQAGDIVSLLDHDGGVYFAQLRGFLQDQYLNTSTVITWLLPTTTSPTEGFDPSTYILGPEEDMPRKMECFEFVCHAPSDYFKSSVTPYPTKPMKPEIGYIWTSLGPEIRPVPTNEEIYGLSLPKSETHTGKGKGAKKKKVPTATLR